MSSTTVLDDLFNSSLWIRAWNIHSITHDPTDQCLFYSEEKQPPTCQDNLVQTLICVHSIKINKKRHRKSLNIPINIFKLSTRTINLQQKYRIMKMRCTAMNPKKRKYNRATEKRSNTCWHVITDHSKSLANILHTWTRHLLPSPSRFSKTMRNKRADIGIWWTDHVLVVQ